MLIAVLLTSVVPPFYADAQQMTAPKGPNNTDAYNIEGAGASFPFPLIDRWRVELKAEQSNFNLNYQSIGSGGGVKNYIENTVAFAGTDAPLTKSEIKSVPATLHLPETIGAVNIVYNIPELPESGLQLTGQAAADIFEGKITKWNDKAIAKTNPGVSLPNEDILVVHRSDGSGTTKVFTQYLSSVSDSWDANIGAGKSVNWPVGVGSPGNEGVAGTMVTTPYSIGYVSIAYAIQNDMANVALENGDKTAYVVPSLETTARAAGNLAQAALPPAQGWWKDVNLLNAPGEDSYPIATFTYLLVREDISTSVDSQHEAEGLVWMIHWMVTEGQQYAPELGFVPLPDEVVELVKQGLGRIRYDGSLVWDYNPVVQSDSGREFRIDAAGASFAFPLMDLWRVKYAESHPNVSLNYQSIGSGGGVKQHIEKTVNFAASDAPLKDSEYEKAPNSITIPEMIGAISLAYNVPGAPDGVKLTEQALCDIFLGKITSWDDPLIAEHNPDANLSGDVVTAHRSDGSGTTFAFTTYLAKVCPEWDEKVGAGKSVPWPSGIGAAGNEGVAGIVKSTEGAIGYVTLAYAFQESMTTAAIQNADHTNFVMPTLATASAASKGAAATLPAAHESWRGVDLSAAPGEDSYPITSFSYLILHPDLKGSVKDYEQAKAVGELIAWIITDGQKYNADLLYVPIAVPVVNIGLEGLSKITYDGQSIYDGPTNIGEGDLDIELPAAPVVKQDKVPSWLKDVFKFYSEGLISDDDLINGIQFLVNEGYIKLK